MPASTDLNIDHIATLARIALTPEEKVRFSAQIGDVLTYIAQLREVNVTGVEPTAHAFPVANVWGEDVPGPALPIAAALRNAPEEREEMIVVPKVVE